MKKTPVYLRKVVTVPSTDPSESGNQQLLYMALQEIEGSRVCLIGIDPFLAQQMAAQLQKIKFPRPLTHPLMLIFMKETGYSLREITITEFLEDCYRSIIYFTKNDSDSALEIDARPSDAVLLALHADSPISMNDELLYEDSEFLRQVAELERLEKIDKIDKNILENISILEDMNIMTKEEAEEYFKNLDPKKLPKV